VETFHSSDLTLRFPGITAREFDAQNVTLPDAAAVTAASDSFWNDREQGLTYVKLHGSFNWRRHDGSRALVIGANKEQFLSAEPLLKWYQDIFRRVLNEPERHLLVIGYSFRDTHINEMILSAVSAAGLKLYVMSPQTPETFRDNICETRRYRSRNQIGYEGQGDDIWKALYGYYCGSVESYYTPHQVQLPPRGHALFKDLGFEEFR
jgi:hypothetical protein